MDLYVFCVSIIVLYELKPLNNVQLGIPLNKDFLVTCSPSLIHRTGEQLLNSWTVDVLVLQLHW